MRIMGLTDWLNRPLFVSREEYKDMEERCIHRANRILTLAKECAELKTENERLRAMLALKQVRDKGFARTHMADIQQVDGFSIKMMKPEDDGDETDETYIKVTVGEEGETEVNGNYCDVMGDDIDGSDCVVEIHRPYCDNTVHLSKSLILAVAKTLNKKK